MTNARATFVQSIFLPSQRFSTNIKSYTQVYPHVAFSPLAISLYCVAFTKKMLKLINIL